ncbi:MAG: ribbon-helix-helix domain-containing protein [Candidatus Woesearchaeota archaeon]|jgi:metal-responsive CopG/Arc/MetJ family transcriptional regulator|nr:ribbon-helix-helix domain-containing protein [Candidatus Woesearchaeota archaeon]
METICLKMEEKLASDMDNSIKNFRYSTRTEFIRDAIRSKLNELEKEEVIKKLAEFKGSLKAKRSDEEAGKIAIKKIADKLNVRLD